MPRLPILTRQVGLPATTGAPRLPDTSGLLPGAVSRGLGRLEQVAERRRQLQQATDALKADLALQEHATRLEAQLETDTVYDGMEDRYVAEFARGAEGVVRGIRDPQVQARVEIAAGRYRLGLWQAANARAVGLQVSDARAAMEATLDTLRQQAAAAEDEPGRLAAREQAARTISALVVGGALDAATGTKRFLTFDDDVLDTRATIDIDRDPYAAEKALRSPTGPFADLSPERRTRRIEDAQRAQRAVEAAEARREAQAEKARIKVAKDLAAESWQRALDGTLTVQELDNNRRSYEPDEYVRIRTFVTTQRTSGGPDDPDTVRDFRLDLFGGVPVSRDRIMRAVEAHKLSYGTAKQILAESQEAEDRISGDPEYREALEQIDLLIETQGPKGLFDKRDPDGLRRKALARLILWEQSKLGRRPLDIVQQDIKPRLANTPPPRFRSKYSGRGADLVRDHEAGVLSDREFLEESELLLQELREGQAAIRRQVARERGGDLPPGPGVAPRPSGPQAAPGAPKAPTPAGVPMRREEAERIRRQRQRENP